MAHMAKNGQTKFQSRNHFPRPGLPEVESARFIHLSRPAWFALRRICWHTFYKSCDCGEKAKDTWNGQWMKETGSSSIQGSQSDRLSITTVRGYIDSEANPPAGCLLLQDFLYFVFDSSAANEFGLFWNGFCDEPGVVKFTRLESRGGRVGCNTVCWQGKAKGK